MGMYMYVHTCTCSFSFVPRRIFSPRGVFVLFLREKNGNQCKDFLFLAWGVRGRGEGGWLAERELLREVRGSKRCIHIICYTNFSFPFPFPFFFLKNFLVNI